MVRHYHHSLIFINKQHSFIAPSTVFRFQFGVTFSFEEKIILFDARKFRVFQGQYSQDGLASSSVELILF